MDEKPCITCYWGDVIYVRFTEQKKIGQICNIDQNRIQSFCDFAVAAYAVSVKP